MISIKDRTFFLRINSILTEKEIVWVNRWPRQTGKSTNIVNLVIGASLLLNYKRIVIVTPNRNSLDEMHKKLLRHPDSSFVSRSKRTFVTSSFCRIDLMLPSALLGKMKKEDVLPNLVLFDEYGFIDPTDFNEICKLYKGSIEKEEEEKRSKIDGWKKLPWWKKLFNSKPVFNSRIRKFIMFSSNGPSCSLNEKSSEMIGDSKYLSFPIQRVMGEIGLSQESLDHIEKSLSNPSDFNQEYLDY